jgi:predicted lipid-binding transport protein (Tim44 family)
VLFFGLFIFAASRWTSAKSDLTVQKQAAYALGKQDQAAAQDQQVREQIETPFRTYTAPTVYGEFVVKYPKNWNAAANEEPSGSLDNLILDSNTIKRNTDYFIECRL